MKKVIIGGKHMPGYQLEAMIKRATVIEDEIAEEKKTLSINRDLNHMLSANDGYGDYTTVIASQANTNSKKELLVTVTIVVAAATKYFTVFLTKGAKKTKKSFSSFEQARDYYNKLR